MSCNTEDTNNPDAPVYTRFHDPNKAHICDVLSQGFGSFRLCSCVIFNAPEYDKAFQTRRIMGKFLERGLTPLCPILFSVQTNGN